MWKLGLTKDFNAAHFLPGHPKCGVLHGHTWKVEVQIESTDLVDNMIVDFANIKDEINRLDHKNLNEMFDYPTAEVIAGFLDSKIGELLTELNSSARIVYVRVWESKDCYAEWSNEE